MAKLIHKYNKNYIGLGNFEIRITLNLKNGLFETNVPFKSLKPGNLKLQTKEQQIIDTIHLYNHSYNELLKSIDEEYNRYERFNLDFERIIMINIEEKKSYMDSSGRGIVFNWGVFRKYKNPRHHYSEFELETSNPNTKVIGYQNLKEWKQIKYSEASVDFLMKIDNNLEVLINNLVTLINSDNIEEKLLMLGK